MRLKKVFKKDEGFTVLEVMIVLIIIIVIIAIGVGGYRVVQEVSRDTQRRALVRDIELALESYNEKNNEYPADLDLNDMGDHIQVDAEGEIIDSKINFDPIAVAGAQTSANCTATSSQMKKAETDSGNFSYCYVNETKGYRLVVQLERSSDPYDAGNV